MFQLLIVDDEAATIEGLAAIPWSDLQISVVHTAMSAAEALALVELHEIDIVITDIRMPKKSGIELIAELYLSYPAIKCILLSGYAEFSYAKQALRSQAVDYLLKPVSDEDLMKAVQEAISQIEQERHKLDPYYQVIEKIKENRNVLSGGLLKELFISETAASFAELQKTLEILGMPIRAGDSFFCCALFG